MKNYQSRKLAFILTNKKIRLSILLALTIIILISIQIVIAQVNPITQTMQELSSQGNINEPSGRDLSTAEATIKAISEIKDIEQDSAIWLYGEWMSYDDSGGSYKLIFHDDGSYDYENTIINNGKTVVASSKGQWFVFTKLKSQKHHLFLTDNNNPFFLDNYPLEQESNNAFRIINQYGGLSRSMLYVRSNQDYAIYPGMALIGTFTQSNAYQANDNSDHSLSYSFSKDGSFVYKDFIAGFDFQDKIVESILGTWWLDTANSKLVIHADGADYRFKIESLSSNSMSLIEENGTKSYWSKTFSYLPSIEITNMQGEYQSLEDESYFSIRQTYSGYFVDFHSNFLDFMNFNNLAAKQLANGDLQLFFPAGHFNEGKEIILRASYNRIMAIKGFDVIDNNIQKVSKYPITKNSSDILGGWRSSIFSASGFMQYLFFYDQNIFISTDGYGQYSFDGRQIILKQTCSTPKVYNPSFSNHSLDLDADYSAVPGLRDWGQTGAELGRVLFKHDLDSYQKHNSPILKPHPNIDSGYLFAQEQQFWTLLAGDNYISYRLEPNGTGTWHSGALERSGYDVFDNWQEIPGYSLSYRIKYFIKQEADKEYIVYYPSGIALLEIDNKYSTIADIKNSNDDIRVVELYHRRTTICEDGKYVLPLQKK